MGIMGEKMKNDGSEQTVEQSQTAPGAENSASSSDMPTDSGGNADNADAGGGEQASPEEQQAYEKCVLAFAKILYDDASHQQIMQSLQSSDNPAEALASTAAMIITELDQKSGGKIPESVILPASFEGLDLLGEVADRFGVFNRQIDEQIMTSATQMLVMKLMQTYGASKEDVQAAISSMDPSKVQQIVKQQQGIAGSWANQGAQQQPPQGAQPQQPAAPDQQQPAQEEMPA